MLVEIDIDALVGLDEMGLSLQTKDESIFSWVTSYFASADNLKMTFRYGRGVAHGSLCSARK